MCAFLSLCIGGREGEREERVSNSGHSNTETSFTTVFHRRKVVSVAYDYRMVVMVVKKAEGGSHFGKGREAHGRKGGRDERDMVEGEEHE